MGMIEDKICMELEKKIINWNRVEELIAGLGDDINKFDEVDEECMLSELYKTHYMTGFVNERLTDLFFKHGFDVSANGGKNGASCLRGLCWSSYDKYILNIAEKLLDAGADSTLGLDDDDDDKGVLSSISWKLGSWNLGEYDTANIFAAYYEMVKRQQEGMPYSGVRAFRDAVGECVQKVEKIKVHTFEGQERTAYLFHCGEKQLIASDYIEFLINPYARDEALCIKDVSVEFKCIIGSKIKGLRYLNASLAKLNFDNGYSLMVGPNNSIGIKEAGAWFQIVESGQSKLPSEGTGVKSVTLWRDVRYAENSTFFRASTVVINTEHWSYGLYSHGIKYGEADIRTEKMNKGFVKGLNRRLGLNSIVLKHVEYSGEAIKWVCLECEEGYLYIVTDHFSDIAFFMSEFEVDKDLVLCVDSWTKGLKEIRLVG